MTTLRTLKLATLVACLIGLPFGVFWLGTEFARGKSYVKDCQSACRMGQMRIALLIYHDKHGAFPPTQYQPVTGGPVHSWRVLLAPFFTGEPSKYDFSQEWNSPTNLHALGTNSSRYLRFSGDGDISHYLAIGPNDEWPSKHQPLRSLLVTEGKDQFLIFEDFNSEIHWMEPKY